MDLQPRILRGFLRAKLLSATKKLKKRYYGESDQVEPRKWKKGQGLNNNRGSEARGSPLLLLLYVTYVYICRSSESQQWRGVQDLTYEKNAVFL